MEDLPKETEKISAIRAARISEKIRQAKDGLLVKKAWWSDGPLEDIVLLLLLFFNFYLIFPLIGQEAPVVAFSGPVVPLLTDLFSLLTKTSFYFSLQVIYVIFYLVFPVTFYFLIKKITNRKIIAFFAGLFSSLPVYMFGRTRILGMFFGQDGPHIVSLTIIPLALYFLISYLKSSSVKNLVFSGLSAALVALTSPFGLFTYLFFAGIFTFSEILLGQGRAKTLRFFLILLLTGALCSFWYNPSFFFWMLTGPMGSDIRLMISKLLPISFFALPVLATFGYLLFDRRPNLQPLFIASFCTIVFFIITAVGGNLVPSSPVRYRAEMGVAVSFFAAFLFVQLIEFVKFRLIKEKFTGKFCSFLVNSLNPVLGIVFLAAGLFVRDIMIYDSTDILGVWTDVQKGSVWVARDNFTGIHAYIGYAITFIGIMVLTFLSIRSKNVLKDKVS
ncbi:MAG TPA: hypothetical protein VMR19_04595 [Candidatus Saccharimonadales bacterium]|nr:hypothetical protein [Candidatus Saccharimonadales bacterium]